MQTANDWGSAVVVDPRMLVELRDSNTTLSTRLSRTRTVLKVCVAALVAACAFSATVSYRQANHISRQASHNTDLSAQVQKYRRSARHADVALGALARSHESILEATAKAPSIGSDSWGHRFIVTQYTARSPLYGKDNDGLTSTMWKADPNARIVAVDPKLIPYGSSVWIEGLGWFNAQDCGGAIKGYRLDVMGMSYKDAMEYGKQDRFVIVVPKDSGKS
jgi:3D (Asp-Asp-Asp) domain-containing protein